MKDTKALAKYWKDYTYTGHHYETFFSSKKFPSTLTDALDPHYKGSSITANTKL